MNPYIIDTAQNPSLTQTTSTGRNGSDLSIEAKSWYNSSFGVIKLTINVHPATAAGTEFVAGNLPLRVAIAARADRRRKVPAKTASRVTI